MEFLPPCRVGGSRDAWGGSGPPRGARHCTEPAAIKRSDSSWTRMLIAAFVLIGNQGSTWATEAFEFAHLS